MNGGLGRGDMLMGEEAWLVMRGVIGEEYCARTLVSFSFTKKWFAGPKSDQNFFTLTTAMSTLDVGFGAREGRVWKSHREGLRWGQRWWQTNSVRQCW